MSDNEQRIEAFMAMYKPSATKRGNTFLFDQKTALELLKKAQREGFKLGLIDAFFLTDNTTQPSMADSVDFATYGAPDDREPYEFALSLVGDSSRSNMFFEVIFFPAD